ncbi:phosphohistidine phosphatase SixA [Halomonas nitroreducens]|uniref:Phosphohistidine phosphatase SixA n=1 Tax=Halomonas nitroreducens TaxID=447425 RepID=A0A431UZ80_9GAMM|nr:phosphohistidine phosphatase SixA [Halomonas nitroreducens]RTQ98049.1 phosphohistidine phosphatase SixA [Halomonas nitroreducens]
MAEPLLIMRHGQAAAGSPDPDRRLSEQGQREVARMGAWLATRGDLDLTRLRLLSSPYRRARQTADRVAEALGLGVETLALITPDDPPDAVVDWLLDQADDRPLMLVSHMPLVGALTGLLVDGRADRGLGFATGAIAELHADVRAAGCARLTRVTAPADVSDQEGM